MIVEPVRAFADNYIWMIHRLYYQQDYLFPHSAWALLPRQMLNKAKQLIRYALRCLRRYMFKNGGLRAKTSIHKYYS